MTLTKEIQIAARVVQLKRLAAETTAATRRFQADLIAALRARLSERAAVQHRRR